MRHWLLATVLALLTLPAHAGPLRDRLAELLPQARSHREINVDLGEDAAYTGAVDAFLRSVDARWPVAR